MRYVIIKRPKQFLVAIEYRDGRRAVLAEFATLAAARLDIDLRRLGV